MILAEVVGTVVSSRKDPALEGLKLLAVQPLGKGLAPTGSILVAVDSVGAGAGEIVLIVSGSSARYTAVTSGRPADASILAIVDQVAASGTTIYDKRGSARGVGGLANVAAELSSARSRAANDGAGEATAYLAQGSVRSAALARLAGFRARVGFTTSAGRWLYTRRVPYRDDCHHAERLWSLAAESPNASPTRGTDCAAGG